MSKSVACQFNVFQNSKVRSAIYNEEMIFCAVDVVGVLTDSPNPNRYWTDLKRDIKKEEGIEPYAEGVWLKLLAEDGKMRLTECFNLDGIFEIMLDIRSKKARPFKKWISKLGSDFTQGKLEYKPKFAKAPKTEDRVKATLSTKELNDVVKDKLSQEPDRIFLYLEQTVHKDITGMMASHHKKMMNGDNGIDLLNYHERGIFIAVKEKIKQELEKYPDKSLMRSEIRTVIADTSKKWCSRFIVLHEEMGTLDAMRYFDILPESEKKKKLKLLK